MKQHLVKLLLEEYKQQCLFSELEKKGINLTDVCVNNLDIVLDIVGFPQDNVLEYEDDLATEEKNRKNKKKPIDKNLFCRDWLIDKYFETFFALANDQRICVTTQGLQIESGADKVKVEQMHSDYVDWLYQEFSNWKNGDYD